MKKHSFTDIQDIIYKVERGDFTRVEVKALFSDVRPYLKKESLIKDVGAFIAHPKKKDQGPIYIYLECFVFDILTVFKNGGKINIDHVFTQKQIISELIDNLKLLKFEINADLFELQSNKIMDYILDFLEETKIKLKNKEITKSYLSVKISDSGKKVVHFCFNTKDRTGVVSMKENVAICIQAFETGLEKQ